MQVTSRFHQVKDSVMAQSDLKFKSPFFLHLFTKYSLMVKTDEELAESRLSDCIRKKLIEMEIKIDFAA